MSMFYILEFNQIDNLEVMTLDYAAQKFNPTGVWTHDLWIVTEISCHWDALVPGFRPHSDH